MCLLSSWTMEKLSFRIVCSTIGLSYLDTIDGLGYNKLCKCLHYALVALVC